MSNTAPVEKAQSSDASQATIAASSSTRTKRPFGIFDSMKSKIPKGDRKSTRLNSSHGYISYAVFCLKKKTTERQHWIVLVSGEYLRYHQITSSRIQHYTEYFSPLTSAG